MIDRLIPQPERDWNAKWSKKIPGVAALALSRLSLRLPRRAVSHVTPEPVLVTIGNLGDQIRMLSTLSRFDVSAMRAVSNAESAAAFAIFPQFELVQTFERHGIAAPLDTIRLFRGARARARAAIVPHPFVTQPFALNYARLHGERIVASTTGEYAYSARNVAFVECATESWRAFYETFYMSALEALPTNPHPRPAVRFSPDRCRSAEIVVHLFSSDALRTMPADAEREVLRSILDFGCTPILIGSASDSERANALARDCGALVACGRPLTSIMKLMSEARAFVGVDSSMMNLADAVGLPSVILYTVTTPLVAGPFYAPTRAIELAAPTYTSAVVLTGSLRANGIDYTNISPRVSAALNELLAAPTTRNQ